MAILSYRLWQRRFNSDPAIVGRGLVLSGEQYTVVAVASARLAVLLFGVFAGAALLLATVGIYGVISFSVTHRMHEIGIRMALGAQPVAVVWLVLREGMILAAAGVSIGVGGALTLTRLMSSLVFQVSEKDPLTFVGVVTLLIGVALLACYTPARRATKVDPMAALRYE